MDDLPIFDNHIHLQDIGDNVDAVKEFQKAGGTHLVVSHLPYRDLRTWDSTGYSPVYERTLKLADRVRRETDVDIYVTLGPYPVDLIALTERVGIEKAEAILMSGMDLAAEYVENGRALALGEIGRPHFQVEDDIMDASNRIMKYGMELASDIGCPVVLHTESTTPDICEELAMMADDAGLPRYKVVKHYSPPLVDESKNHGLFPSVLASEKNLRAALKENCRFMMETDFLDDPGRPGAVLGIKTVPRKTFKLLEDSILSERDILQIHKKNPEKVYDIDIDL